MISEKVEIYCFLGGLIVYVEWCKIYSDYFLVLIILDILLLDDDVDF